ncbi:MAG: glycoside hydrolase, partial [Clostridia bacterium]|nr:glycoside hydrolase [Clostridia bacterium]
MKEFENKLKSPPKKYRPVPFWSWNERLNVEETKRQIRLMDEAGLGGFFMHARGGLQTEYLSREWFDNVSASLDEGEKRDMSAWGYDENGWPSGFGGGKVNGLGLKYQQKYLRCEETYSPATDKFTLANVRYGDKLYRCYFEVNPFYVDTLNPEVIGEFLKSTHEKYREELKGDFSKLKGFFTDEPQVSRNGVPWSFYLEEEYEKIYGESIREHLPKLFHRIDGFEDFRFRYWQLVRELFTDSYMGTIGKWCKENGCQLTGHMVLEEDYYQHILSNGCCMPSYEFMDIPGMDHLCRETPSVQAEMQLSSAANQLGKKQILSETFAACGWNVSFEDLRRIYEHQMVHGINLLCQHLEGYSLRGIRKRDYPASLFTHQPWWKDYKVFNDMVSRIGMLLTDGEVHFNILVLHTIES